MAGAFGAALALVALPTAVRGQAGLPSEAEKIGDELYRIGKLTVDLRAQRAVCRGWVNMPRGTIEYLAVAPGGKLHESILCLDVRPLHLQLGLILLGLEPKGGLTVQGDTKRPQGSPVAIYVAWQRRSAAAPGGVRAVKVAAEELAWDLRRNRPMAPNAWVFTGSIVDRDGFVADRELSLVATYRDPAAIVNNVLPTGSDDTVYKVNERIVPPRETPVTVTFQPRGAGSAAGGGGRK